VVGGFGTQTSVAMYSTVILLRLPVDSFLSPEKHAKAPFV
jgi:hypothetical protein